MHRSSINKQIQHYSEHLRCVISQILKNYALFFLFSLAFDDIFSAYTKEYALTQVKTTNMGSMFRLTYQITLKKTVSEKEMIDKLRCRNGNLEIAIGEAAEGSEEL